MFLIKAVSILQTLKLYVCPINWRSKLRRLKKDVEKSLHNDQYAGVLDW